MIALEMSSCLYSLLFICQYFFIKLFIVFGDNLSSTDCKYKADAKKMN